MLALIDKGLSRKKAYQLVQRNAMKVWKSKTATFENLLLKDKTVMKYFKPKEVKAIFDVKYYLKYVNEFYKRIN